MPTPNEVYKQYGQQPFYYVNGLKISNDATTPNSIINVSLGSIIDSSATYQLVSSSSLSSSLAVSGLGGLDTGTVAASSVYAVYLVADPITLQANSIMFSLSLTGPLMPFGYSAYALLGYVATDSSSHILKGYWSDGDTARRVFIFDAPQATAVTAGAATTYTGVALTKWLPAQSNVLAWINVSFVPAAASRVLDMQAGLAAGDQIIITGQVASVVVTAQVQLVAQLVSSVPTVNYKVSNADSNVAVNVAGYTFDL
jgi:hypothetical protein